MSFAARKAKHCATAEWTTKHEATFIEIAIKEN